MKTVKISVTSGDIQEGQRRDCFKCPIARAMKRALPSYHITAGPNSLIVGTIIIDTPIICKDFMDEFDNHGEVKPFGFEIEIKES